ncbi:MAG: low affinity iron permease family protein [Bradyrhizobiaceae bacterium]|nr:low affinity iron permease family protein [Bradyrhizobiaceae bacterium]
MPARRKNKPKVPTPRRDWFSRFAQTFARLAGKPFAFLAASAIVVVWAASGPLFGFSETWQIVINTLTTIVTFLMVFVIQSTQNRDTLAIQVKLAELILHMRGAPSRLADAEDMSEEQLERVHAKYQKRAQQWTASKRRKSRRR